MGNVQGGLRGKVHWAAWHGVFGPPFLDVGAFSLPSSTDSYRQLVRHAGNCDSEGARSSCVKSVPWTER